MGTCMCIYGYCTGPHAAKEPDLLGQARAAVPGDWDTDHWALWVLGWSLLGPIPTDAQWIWET